MRIEMLRQTCFSPISSLDLRRVGEGCLGVDFEGLDDMVVECLLDRQLMLMSHSIVTYDIVPGLVSLNDIFDLVGVVLGGTIIRSTQIVSTNTASVNVELVNLLSISATNNILL